jgi:hypothetical protein
VFSVAKTIVLLARRRNAVILVLTVVAAVAGHFHGIGHNGVGFWDGPL